MKLYSLLSLLFLAGCTQPIIANESYSLAEISLHNTSSDCWIIINNSVYDITEYVSMHPGGGSILQGCGTNSTILFETRPSGSNTPHSTNARNTLINYLLGEVE
ncbi:MAG: cytochrome b5-like heme/steroid binding domain-containing protein [Candidatus Nanoarchaeia archaeon]|nr:cytochrome b5-like heme/steroid binding domain-containing protein [Candidatus Nanoarchaeia archaeon]